MIAGDHGGARGWGWWGKFDLVYGRPVRQPRQLVRREGNRNLWQLAGPDGVELVEALVLLQVGDGPHGQRHVLKLLKVLLVLLLHRRKQRFGALRVVLGQGDLKILVGEFAVGEIWGEVGHGGWGEAVT